MPSQIKQTWIVLGLVTAVLLPLLWMAVSVTAESAPSPEQAQLGSRVRQLLDGPTEPAGPVVVCSTRKRNGLTLFECEADSWGKWEIFWANPDTQELTFLDWQGHNNSYGKHLTTNPGELVVKFRAANGAVVIMAVAVISDLQLCTAANHCYRV